MHKFSTAAVILLLAASADHTAGPGRSDSGRPTDGVSGDAPRPLVEEVVRKLERPPTFPGQADAYYRSKRRAPRGTDTVELYRLAAERLGRMPRHSTGRRKALGAVATEVAAAWDFLGPGNVGGRSRALVIHPKRPKFMYAAGVSGGVWKTRNGGRRWEPIGDELVNLAVNALAMDPADPSVIYAGTGEGYFREVVRGTALPLRGAGIFKTEDAGDSWRRLGSTRNANFQWVNDLVVSGRDPETLYAATRTGVWRSLDAGARWSRVLKTSARGGCLDLEARPDPNRDFLFASCGTLGQATVYRNPDAGGDGDWTAVLSEPGMGRTSVAVAPSRPETVYALAAHNDATPNGARDQALQAVYRSDAGGAPGSWEARVSGTDPDKLPTMLLSNPVLNFFEECGFNASNEMFNMGWYVNTIAVDPVDPERVWAGGVDLFRSDDGGSTWGLASYWWAGGNDSGLHADQHRLVFHPKYNGRNKKRLFVLNDGGIARTNNARARVATGPRAPCDPLLSRMSWRSLNNNYGVTQFYHGTVHVDSGLVLGGTQDNGTKNIFLQNRSGGSWGDVFGGDGGYSAVDPRDRRTIYVTIQGGVVFKGSGFGTFQEATSGITDSLEADAADHVTATPRNFLFIAPLVMDLEAPDRLWLGGTRMWRTDNGAGSWAPASARAAGGAKFSTIAIQPGNSDLVVAGTDLGDIYRTAGATSAGESTVWSSTRPRAGFVSSLAFDPSAPDTLYATYAGFGGAHVWRSDDAGASWTSIDGRGDAAVPNVPVHSIVVHPGDSDRLYLGTDLGVLTSSDGGDSWAVEDTGFPSVVTEWLTIAGDRGERFLYAFTHGRGAWRVPLG